MRAGKGTGEAQRAAAHIRLAHLWLFGLGESVDLLLRPHVVGVEFENLAVAGNGFVDLPIRLVSDGEKMVGPH